MSKGYRLTIPDVINKGDILIAEKIISRDGTILHEYDFNPDNDVHLSDIPKGWLQEIKQPMTCNESFDSIEKVFLEHNAEDNARYWFSNGWDNATANEREKHAPKKSYDDLEYVFADSNEWNEYILECFRKGYLAALKNRGYDEN